MVIGDSVGVQDGISVGEYEGNEDIVGVVVGR